MIVFIKLTPPLGTDIGPFMIYSNWDGFTAIYGINISLTSLLNGVSLTVPDGTTQVKIRCNGLCTNDIIVNVGEPITITSTSTSTSTSTTSSTTSTTAQPGPVGPTTSSTTTSSTTTSTTRRLRYSTSTSTSTTTTRKPNFTTSSTTTSYPSTSSSTTQRPPTTSTSTTTTIFPGICVHLGYTPYHPEYTCSTATSTVFVQHANGVDCPDGCPLCVGDRIYVDRYHVQLVNSGYLYIANCNNEDCGLVLHLINGVVGSSTGYIC